VTANAQSEWRSLARLRVATQGGHGSTCVIPRRRCRSRPHSRGNRRSILVTSSVPGEGRSMLSVNLGIVYAQRGKKVLLLDGDLRTPVLHRRLNLKASLSSVRCLRQTIFTTSRSCRLFRRKGSLTFTSCWSSASPSCRACDSLRSPEPVCGLHPSWWLATISLIADRWNEPARSCDRKGSPDRLGPQREAPERLITSITATNSSPTTGAS
jgi:hypothetical protein